MSSLRSSPIWQSPKQALVDPLRRLAFETVYHNYLPLHYCEHPNWGDALSAVLAGLLSGRRIKEMLWHHQHRYLAIGSILGGANSRAEVWGSGFMWADEKLVEAPQAVHAVRGPRSRAKLLAMGIECPDIYGDPALLFPFFFNPTVEKKYPIGIIPHYSDQGHPWVEQYRGDPQVHIIDIQCGIHKFVEEVKSCELIVSSSLHGVICSDSYGVPNLWIELSDEVWGSEFKFPDYFDSVGREISQPIAPDENMTLSAVIERFRPYSVNIDLKPLIYACPFISNEVLRKLLPEPDSTCQITSSW